MKLAPPSVAKLRQTMKDWDVADEWERVLYNYLVFGFPPGSFFTAVLAGDFHRAMASCHPANTVTAMKALSGWIVNCAPSVCHGDFGSVDYWLGLSDNERRDWLERAQLVNTEQQDVFLLLKGQSEETV